MKTKVSVVLPAFKLDFLKEAIDSILLQTYENFELIVVNDNPTSAIRGIVNDYDDSRIRYYENQENQGGKDLIKHWNNCIQYASGEYLIMASDDDVYSPEYIYEMMSLAEKYPTIDLFYCRIRYIDGCGKTVQISQPAYEFETSIDFIYQRLFWKRKQALQEFFFRTSKLKGIGGFVNFPVAWYSDDATLALMSANGVAYSPKTLFGMRLSGQNISTSNLYSKKKLDALKQYIYWLDAFLPQLEPRDTDDKFMKEKILAEYRPILNDFRLKCISSLTFKDSIKEYNQLNAEKSYSKSFLIRQALKQVLKIRR